MERWMNRASNIRRITIATLIVVGTARQARATNPEVQASTSAQSQPLSEPVEVADAPHSWHIGPMDISGLVDGYYSLNFNGPSTSANGKTNDLYNFDDKTNSFNLNIAKLTLKHDPVLLGARVDFYYGRTSHLINTPGQLEFIQQSYLSAKPPNAKGLQLDIGKFVTSAGAEVIESSDNFNYSRSLLFALAVPYYHFGVRTSMPMNKSEAIGVQLVNGWNNVTRFNGGLTTGLTSAFSNAKRSLNTNIYMGRESVNGREGRRNLVDIVYLGTPTPKFNYYVNYDYGEQRLDPSSKAAGSTKYLWQGISFAARERLRPRVAVAGRLEYFEDADGFTTGVAQAVKEATVTYEYKCKWGEIGRLEYRHDWSDHDYFHKGNVERVRQQDTLTLGIIKVF